MTTGEAKQVLESYLVKNKLDPECVVVVVQNENRFQLTLLSKAENYDYVYALSPCPVNNSDSIQISDLNIGPMPKYFRINPDDSKQLLLPKLYTLIHH